MREGQAPHLVRVFKMPVMTKGYCFGGGKSAVFVEVDFMHDKPADEDGGVSDEELAEFIKGKNYFNDEDSFLVVSGSRSFTIGYGKGSI